MNSLDVASLKHAWVVPVISHNWTGGHPQNTLGMRCPGLQTEQFVCKKFFKCFRGFCVLLHIHRKKFTTRVETCGLSGVLQLSTSSMLSLFYFNVRFILFSYCIDCFILLCAFVLFVSVLWYYVNCPEWPGLPDGW